MYDTYNLQPFFVAALYFVNLSIRLVPLLFCINFIHSELILLTHSLNQFQEMNELPKSQLKKNTKRMR